MVAAAGKVRSVAGVLQVSLAASSWGTWSLFLRPTHLHASVTAPIVLALIGVISLVLVRLDRVTPRWGARTLQILLAISVLDAVNVGAFFAAMDATSVAIAVLTHYLAPILVALLAPWIDRERVKGALAAACVATVGLALVLQPWHAARGALLGGALGALSAAAYASNVFLARRLVERIGAGRSMSYHALLAAAALLPLTGLGGLSALTGHGLALLAIGSVGPGALAGWLFLRGLVRIGASRAAVLAFLEPLVAVLLSFAVWHEPLAPTALLGGAAILAAGAAVATRRSGLPPAPPAGASLEGGSA
jgi:drug/metabolite transporter (DMT)-like permease